jgi:hypothetical protein
MFLLLLTEFIVTGYGHDSNQERKRIKETLHTVKLPPCQSCKVLVDSFKKVRLILSLHLNVV